MEPNMEREIYRLTLENNRMLHKMRRNAFWGGIIRGIVYAALLAAPIWFYLSYMAPIVNRALDELQQIQGTTASAQAKIGDWQSAWQAFQNQFKQGSSTQ